MVAAQKKYQTGYEWSYIDSIRRWPTVTIVQFFLSRMSKYSFVVFALRCPSIFMSSVLVGPLPFVSSKARIIGSEYYFLL